MQSWALLRIPPRCFFLQVHLYNIYSPTWLIVIVSSQAQISPGGGGGRMWPAWPVWAEKTASLLAQARHNVSFSQFNPNQNDFFEVVDTIPSSNYFSKTSLKRKICKTDKWEKNCWIKRSFFWAKYFKILHCAMAAWVINLRCSLGAEPQHGAR